MNLSVCSISNNFDQIENSRWILYVRKNEISKITTINLQRDSISYNCFKKDFILAKY